jgi:hypothetical protein
VSYTDDFGAPRAGGRIHQGNDLMGKKLFHELAATDGTVTSLKVDDPNGGISGNMLTLKADDGWFFYYIHINNDTPGTDDAANPPEYRFAPGITVGSKVKAGDFIAYMGDSGDAETTGPHLHFEVHKPDGTAIDPFTSLRLSQGMPAGTRCRYDDNPTPTAKGYWLLGADGGMFSFGDAPYFGSLPGTGLCQTPAASRMEPSATGKGYWIQAEDGSTFAFGDARDLGSVAGLDLPNKVRIIGLTAA